jgi:hypothetical protein
LNDPAVDLVELLVERAHETDAPYPLLPLLLIGSLGIRPRIPSRWKLASGRTVEDPPVGDVLAKVVETMLRSCGDEEEITSLE